MVKESSYKKQFTQSSGSHFRKKLDTHEVFELYFNEELNLKILEKSNRYASQKNSLLYLTMLDLNKLNAILMFTGYHSLIHTKVFWEKEDDVRTPLVIFAESKQF